MATLNSYSAVVAEINKRVEKAVKMTADEMQEKLKDCIQEKYYDEYDPTKYIPRTYKFLNSAVAKMLGKSSASIGIDEAYFDYEYPQRYTSQSAGITKYDNEHWTGEDQIIMGSQGYHGSAFIRTEGRFWDEFISWADKNAIHLLKKNLIICGVKVK